MNKKVQQNCEVLAAANGLHLDIESGVIYGTSSGYRVQMYTQNANQPYMFTLSFAVHRAGGPLEKAECKAFSKQYKQIVSLQQKQNLVQIQLKAASKQTMLQENVSEALRAAVSFLRQKGFEPCCQLCGQQEETESCIVGNAVLQICPACYQQISQTANIESQQKERTSENLLGGIVGALLGSLIGAACILLISQLGYVAAISGVVMAVCTLKGYELLGKKLSTKGVVLCVLLMALVTFFTNRLDWAISVNQQTGWGFGYSYQSIPYLLSEEAISEGSYYGSLIEIYLFAALGAVPMIRSMLKNQKNANRVYRMRSGL